MSGQVGLLTELMRGGGQPFWSTFRLVLEGRGVDVGRALLAFSVEQGDDNEFAVVVTEPGEVIEVSWQLSTGPNYEWVPITDDWMTSPYRFDVEEALAQKTRG